jgi:hypothetical protein
MIARQMLLIALLAAPSVVCADEPPRFSVDTSLYPYLDRVETDTDLTFTINARLPARFSYFGFINNRGVVSDGDASFVRSEQNLRWRISDGLPLDLNVQAIIVDGPGNDITQLAVVWRVHDTPGFEAFFMRFPGISDRLYLSGFVDQTFDLSLAEELPESPIVTEIQAGARIWDNFYVVAEYRINQFRLGNEHNLAAGIEYKYAWR